MILEDEVYVCDFCGYDEGEFDAKTGNHHVCQKLASASARIATLEAAQETLADALERIDKWAKAYPLDIFPEPDFKRVRELLEAGGITLDAVSASNMRHVIAQVKDITATALEALRHD
jgi:hypothetical protein